MAGLADLVRDMVAVADATTKDLQPTITIERWAGQDEFGTETYASPTLAVRAIVNYRQRWVRDRNGVMTLSRAYAAVLESIAPLVASGRVNPIDPRDRVTLPDGSTSPIIDTQGLADPDNDGPYFSELWFGTTGAVGARGE